ncbi:F-box/kelch-repeat protein At3g23880-like [Lotus japonicus]|uniref:F-box/kelch-repeat protein At3g23880-like n=1 Tax=Lotus japonicus TaxID=34305 RepID=UPI002582D21F|nr:F-box/kelch-repeat protein At3g23880-like [Lotus japonicus]XP_057442629.1 F-box/kelch-repeat protein At3g23880-like [Lotus japonicus]
MAIPDDVAFTILSKLPLKSLKRFTLVHKSWADLLEIPHFMSKFVSKHHSYHDDTSFLLLQQQPSDFIHYHGSLYLLSGDKFEKTVKSDSLPYQEHRRFLRVSGSGIHGIRCLHEVPDYKYVLWNPATNEFRVTPPSPRESVPYYDPCITTHGFGYDHVTDDFKVIRHITFYPEFEKEDHREPDEDEDDDWQVEVEVENDRQDESMIPDQFPCPTSQPFWEIYSLRSNSWRKLDTDMPIIGSGSGMGYDIYTNGVCHWLGLNKCGLEIYLGSFNFSNEIFYTTPLPLDLADTRKQNYLAVLNESIALISIHEETTTFHIWILGELCAKESWTKLFTVGLGPLHGFGLPIGVGKMGDIFFRKENGELALFDLSTHMLKEIAATEVLEYDQIIIYKESILPIGRTVAGEGIGEVRVSPGCHS